ncbi:MAG: hypothetical protein ACOCP8_06645 [archaeon]
MKLQNKDKLKNCIKKIKTKSISYFMNFLYYSNLFISKFLNSCKNVWNYIINKYETIKNYIVYKYYKTINYIDYISKHENTKVILQRIVNIISNILYVGIMSFFILMVLRLFGFEITLYNYISSISIYLLLYEVPSYVAEFRRYNKQ